MNDKHNIRGTDVEKLRKKVLLYVVMTLCLGFELFVGSLLVFHTHLMLINLTSWEYLSWMKISYLKVWPRRYGSPFG